jgi:hypothetical protein
MNKLNSAVTANWYDPSNGNYSAIGTYGNSGSQQFTPPAGHGDGFSDWVLVLTTIGGPVVPVTGVIVSPTTASVAEGATTQLTATVSPAGATNRSVTWTSSDTNVATVNAATGLVRGKMAGLATITSRTNDGNFTATSTITVTTSPGGTTFYRAINCNGSAQTIDGHTFEAMSGAPNFAYFGNTLTSTTNLSPSTDAPRLAMLQSAIWIGSENTDICKFTNVPTGTYAINLYTWEDNQAPGSWQVRINGSVAGTISNSANNVWQKAGPYTVNVINGEIAIGVGTRNNCDPMISGVELWRQNGSATVSMVEGFLKYRGAATQGRLAHLFALGNGITLKSLDVYNLAGRSVLHAENDISDAALDRVNRPGYAGLILRCVDSQDRTHCRLLVGQHR